MGAFTKDVQNHKIYSPLRADFDAKQWGERFDSLGASDDGDRDVFIAGLLFDAKLKAFWQRYSNLELKRLDKAGLRRGLVASANRNLRIIFDKMREKAETLTNTGMFLAHEVTTMKIGGALSGVDYAPDDLLAMSVDGILKPLRDSFSDEIRGNAKVAVDDVKGASVLGQIHSIIHKLWEDVVWLGLSGDPISEGVLLSAKDSKRAKLITEGFWRQMMLFQEMTMRTSSLWKRLPKSLQFDALGARPDVIVNGVGRRAEYKLRPRDMTSRSQPRTLSLRLIAHELYMAASLEGEMPKCPGLTPVLLLSAWELLAAFVERLIEQMPQDTEAMELRKLTAFAPIVRKSSLISLFEDGLQVRRDVATKILNFFTFSKDQIMDGWQCPLVEIDDSAITPIVPAIHSPNTLHMVERWMYRGGVRLDQRGPQFEEYTRKCIGDALLQSKLKDHAAVLPHAYKLPVEGDVDLIIRVGSTVLLIELKCNLYPVRSVEVQRYFNDLSKGASQIIRKTNAIRSNVGEFVRRTNWRPEGDHEFTFVPVVMSNLPTGAGSTIDEAIITDRWILERFFDSGFLHVYGEFDVATGEEKGSKLPFYDSPAQAATVVASYLTDPPQLRHFRQNTREMHYPVPPLDDQDALWVIKDYEIQFSLQQWQAERQRLQTADNEAPVLVEK